MIIYLISCAATGMKYVGQHKSSNIVRYWNQNVAAALRGTNCKPRLYNAIKKYGPTSFHIQILKAVDTQAEADLCEREFIKSLNTKSPNGYNLTDGGQYVQSGLTEESIAKIRAALKGNTHTLGRKHSALARLNMSKAQQGHPSTSTAEGRKKQSVKTKGRKRPPFSEAWKENIRLAAMRRRNSMIGNKFAAGGKWNIGRKHTEETRRKVSEARRRR